MHASRHVCLGVGRMAMGRVELFRRSSGLAVALEQRVYRVPSLNGAVQPQQAVWRPLSTPCRAITWVKAATWQAP